MTMPRYIENPFDPDYEGEPEPDRDGYPDDYADLINGYAEELE
jgi:hypothetical protein